MTTTTRQTDSQAIRNAWAHYEGWLLAYELGTCPDKLTAKRVKFICNELGVNPPENIDSANERSELARDYITNSALSVEVKSGWQSLGEQLTQQAFRLCFTTGGPSLYLQGELDRYEEPVDVGMYCGDWGEWGQLFVDKRGVDISEPVLAWVATCFYFGS